MAANLESDGNGTEFALKMLADDHASAHLGIRLIRSAEGTAAVTMTVTDFMTNGHGMTHGGFVFALADTAFALACNGYGRLTVAASATINFIAPTYVNDQLTAEAVERIRWARSGIYDVTVRRDDTVVAEFRGNSREIREQH